MNVLLQEEHLQEIQVRIQRAVGAVVPEDYLRIAQAIRARQPARAAAAMRAHIDRLIHVVESFRAERKRGSAPARARPRP